MTQRPTPLWPAPRALAPVRATVAVPGSKSLTNRYIALAAVAGEESRIINPLISRDTELMLAAIEALGARVDRSVPGEVRITPLPLAAPEAPVASHGDSAPEAPFPSHGDSAPEASVASAARLSPADDAPVTVACGLAGTVMRFIPPLAAATRRTVRIDGDPESYARPMGPVLDALRALGVRIDADSEHLPFSLSAPEGVRGGPISIDASASSQFVSGLLLAGCLFDEGLTLTHSGRQVPSRPHIEMTLETMRTAGIEAHAIGDDVWRVEPGRPRGFTVTVEPDLSNAATFLAAALVTGGEVSIPHWPASTTQAGDAFIGIAERFGGVISRESDTLSVTGPERLHGIDIDLSAVGELTPVTAAVAACAPEPSHLHGIGHLRGHETDRLAALTAELSKLGAEVTEHPDALSIHSPARTGAQFETYHDHRMVMAAAVLGLVVEDLQVRDVGTVAKTMPEFTELWARMLADGHRGA